MEKYEPKPSEAHFKQGKAYIKLEQYTDALAAFKKCIALEPTGGFADRVRWYISNLSEYDPQRPQAYYFEGIECSEVGRYMEAIDAFKKAIALKPDYAWAYYIMGKTYEELKKYPDAIAAYKKAIDIKPDCAADDETDDDADADVYFSIGNLYEELGQGSEALDAYQKYIAIEPKGLYANVARKHIKELENRDRP